MASFWFLKLALKCLDYLSWPALALVYPLCASIEAIENGSHSDTRNLISYWTLLALIYLFEYAFLKLLHGFLYWNYMKLMIIAFLVTPDFGRASYVYSQLIRSCISMNPQTVISRFRNWKKMFVKKEDFLMQAEKFITENGTEALEKLIASKNPEPNLVAETKEAAQTTEKNETQQNTAQNLDEEITKNVPITEKNEVLQINMERVDMEHKDAKDLEITEKAEISSGKQSSTLQANATLCSLKSNEKTSSTVTEVGVYPQSCASKNVQKEWTCAICQVTTTREADLKSHIYGKKHKAALEALKANTKKNHKSINGEPEKMISTCNALEQKITTSHPIDHNHNHNNSRFRCDMCNVNCTNEGDMASHLQGREHLAQTQFLQPFRFITSPDGLFCNTPIGRYEWPIHDPWIQDPRCTGPGPGYKG